MRQWTWTILAFYFSMLTLGLAACGRSDLDNVQQDEVVAVSCNDRLDIQPLALEDGYCVLARLDDPDPASTALAFDDAHLWQFAGTKTPATSEHTLTVTRYDLNVANSAVSAPSTVLQMALDPGASVDLFAGGYIALTASNTAAVGYTRSGDFGGEIYLGGSEGDDAPLRFNAPSNFDAVWLDADALLINGKGADDASDGQAVYVWDRALAAGRKLITGLGEASSFMARGSSVVFVGAPAWPDNNLYAFTAQELRQAIDESRTLDATRDGDLVHVGQVIDIAALGDTLVVLDTSYDEDFNPIFHGVRQIATTVDGDTVSVGEHSMIVNGGGASTRPDALATYADMLALRLVDGQNPRTIAIVSRR